jgi:type III restriction enzyme
VLCSPEYVATRWDTSGPSPKNHVKWAILDSDWEAEFCRVAGAHPKVIAYTKNHSLGREPYRHRVASVQLGR